jgi:sigma-E factor negative regulatory protein RseA
MNQQIHEQLSALTDGELERDQIRFLLKRMDSGGELPLRWARYHVVRQVLRRQQMTSLAPGFADAVMARLAAEPLVHARTAPMPIWLRWGAGGAIAASVAVAALLVTQPAGEMGSASGSPGAALAGVVPQTAPAGTMPVAANGAPGEFRTPLLAPNVPETAPASFGTDLTQPAAIDPHMQSYLMRHYQAVGGSGQSEFVPYVLLGTPERDAARAPVNQSAVQNH